MAVLSFVLAPEAIAKLYETLICLAKFGESVAIEARKDKVTALASKHATEPGLLTYL